MSDLTLGTTPARLTVWLVDAAPFAASVTADAAFPAPPELVFDTGTVWPAALSGDGLTAAWLHPAADVDALAALSPRRVTLRDPASHHVWAHGTVYVARVVDSGDASTVAPGGSITVDQLDGAVSITYVVGEGGPGGGVTDHGALSGLEDDDHPQYLTEQRGDARYATATHDHDGVYVKPADLPAPPDLSDVVRDNDPRLSDPRTPTSHTHTAAQISDATTTGRAVMQASSPTAARTAIGAGTSNLQLGTGPTTAAAGDHGHDLNAVTDTASRVAMTPAERTKLSGVASGATANATDAQLRDRATHTGAQAISTVTGLQGALDGKADTGHLHDARYVRTVNGTGPDGSGNVVVSGGGGGGGGFTYPPGFHVMPLGPATTTQGQLQAGWVCLKAGHIPGGGTVVGVTVQVTTASAGNPVRLGLYTQTSAGQYALVHDFGAFDPATVGLHTLSGSWAVPAGAYILAAAAAAAGSPSLTRTAPNGTPTRTGDFDAADGRLMKMGDFSTGLPATISAPAENAGPFPAIRFTYA